MRNVGSLHKFNAVEEVETPKEYDPEGSIHEAVLAEKEKRKLKLVPARIKLDQKARLLDPTVREAGKGCDPDLPQDRSSVLNLPTHQRLTREIILLWAEMHFDRTGERPQRNSGPVADSPGEWWNLIDTALSQGGRGLPGGESLAELINESRTVLQGSNVMELTEELVVSWADEWRARTGSWPDRKSSEIASFDTSLTWAMINAALLYGSHGLAGGTDLRKLIKERRG